MSKTKIEMLADEIVRFGRQAKQGATFGWADEVQDIPAAAYAAAMTDMSYKDALKMARELSKNELSNDWKESPYVSGAGQVVGSIPLGFSKAGASATNWIRSGSALSGVGKGAAVGAGYGAAAGLGAADDTIRDRARGFGLGGVFGGLVGGLTAPLTRMGGGGGPDYNKVVKKTAKGFENKAEKELAKQLAARPDLREQLLRAEAMAQASKNTGIQLTLPEIVAQSSSDPLLAQQAVLTGNPMTAGRMQQMYSARSGTPNQAGQIESVLQKQAQDLAGGLGSYDEVAQALIEKSGKAAGNITKKLVEQARPLYDEAYKMNIPSDDSILQNPLIISTLDKVKKNPIFAQEIGDAADNSIQALDAVKRSLDDMAEAANRAGNRNEARLIQNARTQLLAQMDAASPQYGQARAVYSGNPDQLAMRGQIGALADIDPMQAQKVAGQLFSGTQQNAELAAKALGPDASKAASARIFNAMDTARGDPTSLAGKIAPDARSMDMLRTYAGGNQLDETLDVINQAKLGERMRYGSPTQPRMEAEKSLAGGALNAAVDVKTGGATAVLRKVAQFLGRGDQQTDPQFYSDMADLMLTDKGMDLVRRVASGQQNAIQELQQTGLPSLAIGGLSKATGSLPVARAGISYISAQQQPESVLRVQQPQDNRFNEFDRILQQPQNNRFDEFDKILGVK